MTDGRSVARFVLAELGRSQEPGPSGAMAAVARSLRDAGAEVVHGGLLTSVRAVVHVVEQEDPAVLVLGVVAETGAVPDPAAAMADLAAALPPIPLFGLGEQACGAGLPMLPDELDELVGSLATVPPAALRPPSDAARDTGTT